MKKLCMLMAVILLFSFAFTSCGLFKPSDAESLMKRIDKAMSKVYSYKIENKMNMTFYSDRSPIVITATGETIAIESKDDNYYYDSLTTKVESAALELDEETTSIMAYNDGKMFSSSTGADLDQKLCSSLDFEEFEEFLSDEGMEISDLFGGDNIELNEKEDGGWKLKYSEFSKEKIDDLVEKIGINDLGYDFSAKDVNTTVECNKKYRVEKIKMSVVFEELEVNVLPSFEMEMNYSDYDEAERITNTINPADYQEVDDVRIIYEIEDMIDDKKDSDEGSFSLNISQTVKYGTKTIGSSRENSKVNYGKEDGKYYYSISSSVNGEKVTINYKDGTTTGSHSEATENTDREAKAVINALIDGTGYSASRVTKIEKVSNRVYKMAVSVPMSSFREMFDGMNVTYNYSKCEITVTLGEDKIEKISSSMTINFKVEGNPYRIDYESSLSFYVEA